MTKPTEKPIVKLIDTDGNAFAIMGRVREALHKAGADKEYVDQYLKESMFGDYDNLLCVTMNYVHVIWTGVVGDRNGITPLWNMEGLFFLG